HAVEQDPEPGGPQLIEEMIQLPGLHDLPGAVVCAGGLAHEERAEENGRHDGEHEDEDHEDRGRQCPGATEQPDQPGGQRVERERQDRGPRERADEGQQEEEQLIEEQAEHDEEERRKEPLARHGGTVQTGPAWHKATSRLDTRGGHWYEMPPYRALTQARSSVARALP